MRQPYVNFRELKAAVPIRSVLERYGLMTNLRERGDISGETLRMLQDLDLYSQLLLLKRRLFSKTRSNPFRREPSSCWRWH